MEVIKKILAKCLRWTALIIFLVAIPLIAIPTYDRFYYSDKIPPSNIKTISDFIAWQPSYSNARKVENHGSVFYVVQGDYSRFLASSKAEYYFDKQGIYINWNKDPGDLVTLPIIQDNAAKHHEITIHEIGK